MWDNERKKHEKKSSHLNIEISCLLVTIEYIIPIEFSRKRRSYGNCHDSRRRYFFLFVWLYVLPLTLEKEFLAYYLTILCSFT
jgi:hypothetical protein